MEFPEKIGLEEEDLHRRVEWNVESIRSHLRGKANSVTRRLIFTDIHDKKLLPSFKQTIFGRKILMFLIENKVCKMSIFMGFWNFVDCFLILSLL